MCDCTSFEGAGLVDLRFIDLFELVIPIEYLVIVILYTNVVQIMRGVSQYSAMAGIRQL